MFDIFSTREVATGIWIIILIAFLFTVEGIRNNIFTLVKTAMNRYLAIPFLVLVTLGLCLIPILSLLPFWDIKYVKDLIMGVLFVGIPACFGAINTELQTEYFSNIVENNFKLGILLEFLISTYTFHLGVELILVPVLSFIVLIVTVSALRDEYKLVFRFFNSLQALIGIGILLFAMGAAINDLVTTKSITDNLIRFTLPILISLFYIPIAYVFGICDKYIMVFKLMSFRDPKDEHIRRARRWKIVKAFKLSYGKILRFKQEGLPQIYGRMNEDEFDTLLETF